ncbi:SphA family protein [Marinomonas sp.]|uniref:SphA family protein n=1 Tax=Marinomonas sp. TaxID=1904862 RepID=UPI003BAC7005
MTAFKRVFSCALLTLPISAMAYDLPGVNLGGTSFYDGAPGPQGSGWYLIEYLQSIKTSTLNGSDGKPLSLPKQDLDVFVPLTQLIYVSDKKIDNMTPGYTVLAPFMAKADVDDGMNNNALKGNTGLGDISLGAFLQFDPVMGENGPRYSQRIELDITLPTGDYDASAGINPGSNAFNINPYYALTYWLSPRWTASTRIAYLWNGKNDKPSTALNATSDSQAGQAIHINFASAYAVTDTLSLGLNGYWLDQITDTKVDGKSVKGRKEKVWAVGPGLVYQLGKEDSLVANLYFEQDAVNRAEGNRFVLRFNHHF